MKIIDILNKMADGTLKDGFKFRYRNELYEYDKNDKSIRNKDGHILGSMYKLDCCLIDEVEVIEDDKEIIPLSTKLKNLDTWVRMDAMQIKINELVEAVNKLQKEAE